MNTVLLYREPNLKVWVVNQNRIDFFEVLYKNFVVNTIKVIFYVEAFKIAFKVENPKKLFQVKKDI